MTTHCIMPFPKANFGGQQFYGAITYDNIIKLSRFETGYLRRDQFLPGDLCDKIVDRAEGFLVDYPGVPGVKILPDLPSHFGAKDEHDYVKCANSPANIMKGFAPYEESIGMVLAMLKDAGFEAEVLEVDGHKGIGLMFRAMRELRTHTDWAIREIPSWSMIKHIDPAFSQIAVNIDLNSLVYSAVTTVVERSYNWQDEKFKSKDDGFSYDTSVTLNHRTADYMMLKGDITLFNSNCYHRVWVSQENKYPRYTLGGFLVKIKNSKKLLLFA